MPGATDAQGSASVAGDDVQGATEPLPPLDQLRSLLLEREQRELAELRSRLDHPQPPGADQVAEVLTESLRLTHEHDRELPGAMEGPLIAGLRHSVQRDPSAIAGILFPVMGPAIRNAISDSLRKMVESINRTLEHSLSFQGLKWRLESLRTGVPFAEVVMRHSIDYRVEEVLLIRPDNGLLIQHAVDPGVEARDPDAVSAMLTAICSFVRDAFLAGSTDQGLEEVEMEEHKVLLVNGPHAYLACAVRGIPPLDLRERCKTVVEELHRRYGEALARFEGDRDALAHLREPLAACLLSQEKPAPTRRGLPPFWYLVLALALLAGWLGYQDGIERQTAAELHARQEQLLTRLRTTPGLILTEIGHDGRTLRIEGLRDPLAKDPTPLAGDAGLAPEQVQWHWAPYQDMGHDFALARARERLRPPEGVRLTLEDSGRLVVAGEAPITWRTQAALLALTVPGVTAYDDSGLAAIERRELLALKERLESNHILFVVANDRLNPDQNPRLDTAIELIRRILTLSQGLALDPAITLVGRTDLVGTSTKNIALGQGRANGVRDYLVARGVPPALLRVTTQPPPPESLEQSPELRRVEFQLTLEPAQ